MVKGISRQVIMVRSPDQKLFDQAIFILKDTALQNGVTDEALLREAQQAIRADNFYDKRRHFSLHGIIGAVLGALLTGLVWLVTALL